MIEVTKKHLQNLHEFYKSIHNDDLSIKVSQYYTKKKLEKIRDLDTEQLSKDFFNFDINPEKLKIELVENPPEFFKMSQITTSLPLESQIGRQLNIGVRDKVTNTWLGFIKLSSPILSLSSRNTLIGHNPRAVEVNKHIINGSIILPTQPFGFNYLGGKLLALVCVSNEVRDMLIKKYPQMTPVLFETTSLWGSIKGISQYNGLRPYIKSHGLTKSDSVVIYPTSEVMTPLRDHMRSLYGQSEWGGMLVNPIPSGPKLREYKKIIQLLKKDLTDDESGQLLSDINSWSQVPTQKGYYYSTWGIENWKDVITNGHQPNKVSEKWDLENLIQIWKSKSVRRWMELKSRGDFRTELEIWNIDTCQKGRDIIR